MIRCRRSLLHLYLILVYYCSISYKHATLTFTILFEECPGALLRRDEGGIDRRT